MLAEGGTPLVIDSQKLLRDPAGVLGRVCDHLGLRFDPTVLTWEPGPVPEDGAWAPYWYENVHKSTGFAPYQPKTRPVPENLKLVLAEAMPLYERLLPYAVG